MPEDMTPMKVSDILDGVFPSNIKHAEMSLLSLESWLALQYSAIESHFIALLKHAGHVHALKDYASYKIQTCRKLSHHELAARLKVLSDTERAAAQLTSIISFFKDSK